MFLKSIKTFKGHTVLPYFIANFLSVGVLFIGYSFKFNRVALFSLFLLATIPLIFISSFKAISVGTDTVSYVYFYNQLTSLKALLTFTDKQGELGFWFLNYLGHSITSNHYIIFLFSSIIITGCYFYSIKTLNLRTLSLFTLLFIGPYYFQLNGTRQAIAIAIFSVSIIFILKKQPIKYLISIAIGFFFHKSIIICLPIYYLLSGEIKPRKVVTILFLFLVLLIFFQTFIDIASDIDARYSSYGEKQEKRGGLVVSAFNILLLGWFVLCRQLNSHILATKTFDRLLTLYLLGTLISILSMVLGVDPSGFLRMSIYFVQMNIFLLPMTILSFRDDTTRYIVTLAAMTFMMLYFALTTSTFSHLTPYKFNPILGI